MRNSIFVGAASADFRVRVLVVPVAGLGPVPADGDVTVLPMPDASQVTAAAPALLASPAWRERVSRSYPLPLLARLAPPTLAAAAAAAMRPRPGTAVHVARSYLAPLGVALAERIGSPWLTADLDDDDEGLADSAGHHEEARAYGRLVGVFGPSFRGLCAAAPGEADAISGRHGFTVTVIPNAVAMPAWPRRAGPAGDGGPAPSGGPAPAALGEVPVAAGLAASRAAGRGASLLFVGNLGYWPNADAAARLVRDVLPILRSLISGPVTVTLAGDTGMNHELHELAAVPGVRLTGFVPDLEPCYAAADVLAVPLAFGAGTRIKLLEAFARGVPVVTTTQGAAGLELVSGEHALIADTAPDMAVAVARLMADPGLRGRLATAARRLVLSSYSREAVIPRIREFLQAAAPDRHPAGAGRHPV
jgi:glycosyltransferase involved in cell wall biosynthesis